MTKKKQSGGFLWKTRFTASLSLLLAHNCKPSLFFRRAHTSIMTPENSELIQKSIYSLIFTLKNIEVRS